MAATLPDVLEARSATAQSAIRIAGHHRSQEIAQAIGQIAWNYANCGDSGADTRTAHHSRYPRSTVDVALNRAFEQRRTAAAIRRRAFRLTPESRSACGVLPTVNLNRIGPRTGILCYADSGLLGSSRDFAGHRF